MTDADPELTVTADPVRLRQAIGNLVSNAVRHTPPGGTVRLTASGEPAGRARHAAGGVRVEVRDTGAGIAPEDLPHVFDRFWRAEKSRSRQTGGSGLGLLIVRKLVEAHGGTVAHTAHPAPVRSSSCDCPATAPRRPAPRRRREPAPPCGTFTDWGRRPGGPPSASPGSTAPRSRAGQTNGS